MDDGASWKPVVARPAGSEVSIGGCDSSGLKDGVLVTGDDGIAAFTGLQIDNQTVKIRYRLTEIATRDGSTLMTTVLYDGSLPDVNGDTEITDVKITAVNNRNLELPNSGGSGFPCIFGRHSTDLYRSVFLCRFDSGFTQGPVKQDSRGFYTP